MKDKPVQKLIQAEQARQRRVINLIASENYVSQDVLAALGSVLVNKYAEGYPGARYYGGNKNVDALEKLCQTRALKLFRLKAKKWSVNVQPLSGSPANLAVYLALAPTGSKIMGLNLAHGGHLTHGHKVSATGKLWQSVPYGVAEKTEQIDYEAVRKIARREKPAIIVAGYTAYSRTVDWKKFRQIADVSGAILMVDLSHLAGLVAGGVYSSPFPFADVVTMTTHKTLRGPRAALIFSKIDERGLAKKINQAVFPGLQGGPHINQIAATAVALNEAAKPEFKRYVRQIIKNTKALAGELSRLGWRIISGGTDSHLFLVDVWAGGRGLSGKAASDKLERAGIVVNKNQIPFDSRPPADPSGLRLGLAAETTRGKKEKDLVKIARQIDEILRR